MKTPISASAPVRTAKWLIQHNCGPNVFAFRNLESGQVVFSQSIHPKEEDIERQFQYANWQNKKPKTRKDVWRPMAVAQLPDHKTAVRFYVNLIALRQMRDRDDKTTANQWRKKSDDGNIWFYSQFRPTYTQEAVADLASASEAEDGAPVVIHWENEWRRGADSHWEGLNVTHRYIPRHNPREQHVVLKKLADSTFEKFAAKHANTAAAL